MPSSLPLEIKNLMLTTCIWELFNGFDGHAEPTYKSPKTLQCYREAHSLLQTGLEVNRAAELTTSDPDWDLYFDGGDVYPESMTLYDRFTPQGTGSNDVDTVNTLTLQATAINTILGPWGKEPWMIVVSF